MGTQETTAEGITALAGGGEGERGWTGWETLTAGLRQGPRFTARQSHLPGDGTHMMVLKYLKIAPVAQVLVLFSLSNPQYKDGIKKKVNSRPVKTRHKFKLQVQIKIFLNVGYT